MEYPFIEVPGPDALWWTMIDQFALTYNAYERRGDLVVISTISDRVRQTWDRDATLPNDLDDCRTTLFFEQRRFRYLDAEPVDDDDRFVRAILGKIRDLSGGRVPGPADSPP